MVELTRGRALARLGLHERAERSLDDARAIVVRTTGNARHPLALVAAFEADWIRVAAAQEATARVLDALTDLESSLWPEHPEVVAARKLVSRL